MADGCKTAYGLDLSAGHAVLARCTRRGMPQPVLTAAVDAGEMVRVLQRLAGEIERGEAVLSAAAPAAKTIVRRLRAPFASVSKAAKVWLSLLDVELPFPVEGAACSFGPARIEDGGTLATAAAIRESDLAAFEETCRAAGIEPTHCDAEVLALWDQGGREAPPARPEQPRVLVWLGRDHAAVIRGRGAGFMAAHVVRASPMAETIADRQAFEKLWTLRMGSILSAHRAETGGTEMDVWWAGPGAGDESLMARLRQGMPAEAALRHEIHRTPGSFLARALARRALEGGGVNFKTGARIHPALARAQARRRKSAYLGVAAAAALVLVLNGVEYRMRRHRNELLQRHLTTAARAVVGGDVVPGQERLMAERAMALRNEGNQPFRMALDPDGVEGRLARALDSMARLGIEVSSLAMSPMAVSIEGVAPSIQVMEGLAEQLRAQGWSVQSDSPGLSPEGSPRFLLKGAAVHEG